MLKTVIFAYVLMLVSENEAARILAYYPTPSISHQVVYRTLTLELVKRGHEVVVITTDPIYPKKDGPKGLKEIDLHDTSYTLWKTILQDLKNKADRTDFDSLTKYLIKIVETQIAAPEVQQMINDKSVNFDLVFVEVFTEVVLGLSHIYKAPIIQFSSLGVTPAVWKNFGAPTHPILYPSPFHEKIFNLTALEKLTEIYKDYKSEQTSPENKKLIDTTLKKIFGPDVPSIEELKSNVDMLFVNVNSLWDFNRPVPPNVVYIGGLHQKAQKELPEDLQKYLDSSKNGVIYVSFGTNVDPGMFPTPKIQALVTVFSKLPYDVLWKWNQDELPGRTENIKISKWLPQADLLRHPKVKLFITQGGLQSTDEAITAGVPLLGIPIFSDQKFNVEQYLLHGIGEKIELEAIDIETLNNAINKVLKDDRYRKSIEKLRSVINDQPLSPLDKAVWWTEYVIRHKGAKHLRSPAANLSDVEYYELELVSCIVLSVLAALLVLVYTIYCMYSCVFGRSRKLKKN